VAAGGPFDDGTGAYGRWFGSLERDTVLVRPDSYLFGTATGPGAAAGLVDALRSALAAPARAAEPD
jgi:3-(3-hydroxy-phenyl)propionate hydroxylase